MEIKTRINHAKAFASLLTFSLLFGGIQSAQATLLDVSQKPLVLSDSVAPNLILTLDDSGSMRWAFVPDDINGVHQTRRAKSAAFNPMYYDPSVTYQLPTRYNNDGSVAATSPYSTSFTAAWNNGFFANNTRGSLNLSTGYKVSWSYDPNGNIGTSYGYSNTTNRLAQNPTDDFSATASRSTNGITRVVKGDISFAIERTASNRCTATATINGTSIPATCTGSNNNYTASLAQVGVPAYYYLYDTSLSGCTRATTDEDCYRLVFVSATSGQLRDDDDASGRDERQNFAIWYSFYRNRGLATLSAANLSFTGLPSSIRLTWQTLGNCTSFTGTGANCGTNYFRRFTDHHRGNFFNWLPTINFNTSTYLLQATDRAGKFLATAEPWYKDPNPLTSSGGRANSETTPTYACRPSFHVLMTDGMWNSAMTVDVDDNSSIASLPDGTSYAPRTPFRDSTRNTLADLAFKYWATDARPNLANDLKPLIAAPNTDATTRYWDPRNNPATWQHMVNYTIGLGLGSALTNPSVPWTGETFAGAGYEALKAGTNWPAAASGSNNNVYDLWHAAINSRGEFFNGDSPDKVVDAFNQILNRIGNYTTSASRPAVTASQVNGATSREVYETEFSSDDWSGDLKKYAIDSVGVRTQAWSAKSRLSGERTVHMAAANGRQLQEFNWTNLTIEQRAFFNTDPDNITGRPDNKGEARVNYIRGNRSNEGITTGTFRTRSSVLGDIVNSAPVVVKDAQYLAYLADRIDGSPGDYYQFQQRVANRKEMIYVGANDGMLHGFNAATGAEELAFVPNAVLPNLYRLTGQNYQSGGHRYYVDGTPVVSDVYFNNAWHTVLIGSLRGGGRSLFALDITDPNNVRPLWEFTHEDMGHTFPQPVVARLHTGKWAVVTGNGYGNQSGATADKAALFVIDVETGELVREVIVDGDTTKANGLSSVRLADNDSDGIADYAYAGDLQGNLWRFDLFRATNSTTPAGNPFASSVIGTAQAAHIEASYGGKPLFKATDATTGAVQPITAAPSLVRHPSQLGYLVMFGTGKYFEDSDGNVNTTLGHSVYAIWDRKTKAETTATPPTITHGNLLAQTILRELSTDINGVTSESRLVSQNVPKWYKDNATANLTDNDVNHWGWRLDLQVGAKAGEMMINPMAARGQALIFSTLTPNDDPCKDGVEAWLYGINPSSGGRTTFSVFDMDGSGDVNGGDTYNNEVVSSRKLDSASGFNLNGDTLFSTDESIVVDYGPTSSGRQSWQVIPKRND